jgi:hypothetical protein
MPTPMPMPLKVKAMKAMKATFCLIRRQALRLMSRGRHQGDLSRTMTCRRTGWRSGRVEAGTPGTTDG